jgi:hypothetical protein
VTADAMTAAMRTTATSGVTHANTPAAASTATTVSADASTAPIAAAVIATAAAIVGAIVISAVIEIAVSTNQAAYYAGDHPADKRFRKNVATISYLLHLHGGPYESRTDRCGHSRYRRHSREDQPGSDKCCKVQQGHPTILVSEKTPPSGVRVLGSERKASEKDSENTYAFTAQPDFDQWQRSPRSAYATRFSGLRARQPRSDGAREFRFVSSPRIFCLLVG